VTRGARLAGPELRPQGQGRRYADTKTTTAYMDVSAAFLEKVRITAIPSSHAEALPDLVPNPADEGVVALVTDPGVEVDGRTACRGEDLVPGARFRCLDLEWADQQDGRDNE
jgi:hypothetical protein